MLNLDNPNSKACIRKIKVIIWKSLTMRKNSALKTLLEIFTPMFIYFLISIIHTNVNFFKKKYYNKTEIYESTILFVNRPLHLVYSPNTYDVNDFMNNLKQELGNDIESLDGFVDENEMENYILALQFEIGSYDNMLGVIFNDYNNDSKVLDYRILMKTSRIGMESTFQLDPPYTTCWADDYIMSNFVSLQKYIDYVFINKKSKNNLDIGNIYIKIEKMPSPPHTIETIENNFLDVIIVSYIFTFSFICLFCCTMLPFMIAEKSLGVRQLMAVMGLESWQYWLGWFLFPSFAYIFNLTIFTILLTQNFTDIFPTFFDHSNAFIVWMLLFCFYICNIVVIFLLSAIFRKNHCAQVVSFIWILIPYYSPFITPENLPLGAIIILMFIPIIALIFAVHTLLVLEKTGGVHFSNLFSKPSKYSNNPSIGLIIIMFIIDAIIYFLLSWYIDHVFPGQFGISKRWNFVFQKSYWTRKSANDEETDISAIKKKPEIEPVSGLSASIIIRNLKKTYKNVNAVDEFNIDIYSKQITVLLGHNGAGKTTTIGMITGMIPPTSGTIVVNGYSIYTNYEEIQKNQGLCLQNNTEITLLTVLEHLLYFGMMRGSSLSESKAEALEFLEMANLSANADMQPNKLSGGMRRKLSMGMAMIGKVKVVLLDEPTSGLDPQSRRDVWNFLLSTHGERTILITTHYMEEADVLGDRIAIMHSGQLICYGTSLFLKKFYGTGYTLSVLTQPSYIFNISSFITNYVPSAFVKSSKGGSVLYTLPTNNTNTLTNLIIELEKATSKLGIHHFSINITSLEDVFIKVGEIADANKGITKINQNWIQSDNELIEKFSSNFFLTFKALVFKRLYYLKHNKFKIIFSILIGILCSLLITMTSSAVFYGKNTFVDLTLEMYNEAESFYSYANNSDRLAKYYKDVVRAAGGRATYTSNFSKSVLDIGNTDDTQYHKTLITGAQFDSHNEIIAMYGHYAIHGLPISVNLITNSLLHWWINDDTYSIKVAYGPLSPKNGMQVFSLAIMLPIGIYVSFLFYIKKSVLILHDENASGFKHLQQMAGVSKLLYWVSAFIFDYITCFFIFSIVTIFVFIIDYDGLIGNSTTLAYISYLVFLFGFSCFPFVYGVVLSNLVATKSKGHSDIWVESIVQLYFIIFGIITPIVALCFIKIKSWCLDILNILPPHALVFGFIKLSSQSLKLRLWNENRNVLIAMGHVCKDLESTECKEFLSFYSGKFGIGDTITFLYWDILIHWILLLLKDINFFSYCFQLLIGVVSGRIFNVGKNSDAGIDDDVLNERTRVKDQIKEMSQIKSSAERDERIDLLLVSNLHKWYCCRPVVCDLYFGVKKGECFGLLGVNGAGKTTTFRLLTGEVFQNYGNAYFKGVNLNLNRCNFFKKMGYAPQFDGFIDSLTVREMLYVFGSIRGIPSNKINNHIEKWLTIFDIQIYEHTQSGQLSGGTKRKLSSALSLIGNPILILLDEPTSGIDPIARRNLWDVLFVLQNSGRSIILTSQSMDECEALCDRLAIMVKGQFKCIGNITYLKSKFGHGCTIKIKLNAENEMTYIDIVNNLKVAITSRINCTLLYHIFGMLVYKIEDKNVALSTVFILMQSLKSTFDIIEDFSISSSNLEEIFLSFARTN